MTNEFWLGVASGLLTNFYTGAVMGRWGRFDQLRNECKRIILAIDFIDENSYVAVTAKEEIGKLVSIQSDLLELGHFRAADTIGNLFHEISESLYLAPNGKLKLDDFAYRYELWQSACRNMRPSPRVILFLK